MTFSMRAIVLVLLAAVQSLKIEVPPSPYRLDVSVYDTDLREEGRFQLEDATPEEEIQVDVFLQDETPRGEDNATAMMLNWKGSEQSLLIVERPETESMKGVRRRNYVVTAEKNVRRWELIEALIDTFVKKKTFDSLEMRGAHGHPFLVDTFLMAFGSFLIQVRRADIECNQTAPELMYLERFVDHAKPDWFEMRVYDEDQHTIVPDILILPDKFFQEAAVKNMSHLVLTAITSNIEDATLEDLNANVLRLGKAPLLTADGIRSWLKFVLNRGIEKRLLKVELEGPPIADQEYLKGLDYTREKDEDGSRVFKVKSFDNGGITQLIKVKTGVDQSVPDHPIHYISAEPWSDDTSKTTCSLSVLLSLLPLFATFLFTCM